MCLGLNKIPVFFFQHTEANRSKQIPCNSTPGKQPSRRDDTQTTTSNHFIPNYSNALNNINNNRRVNNTNNNNFNSNNRPRGNPYPMCEKHPRLLKSKICSRCRVSICDECWRLEHRDKRLHKVELFEDYREKASKHEKKVPSKVNLNVVKNFDKVFRHQKRMFEQVEHFSRLLTQQREREIALKEQLDHLKTAEEMYEIRLRLKECRNEQPRLVAQMEERYERVSKSLNCSLPLFSEMTKNLPQVENGLFPNAGNQFGMSSNDTLSVEIGSPFWFCQRN